MKAETSMVSGWKPDDSLLERIEGELKGHIRVKEALKELGLELGDRIITSRDKSIPILREKLRRTTMPEGFEQWQLPLVPKGKDSMIFTTVGQPHAKFPEHSHANDNLFRIIVSGSIIFEGVELTAGDWMYVPAGCSYSFEVGQFGCVINHVYND